MIAKLARAAKAVTAGLTAGVFAFEVAWADRVMVLDEWVTVAVAVVGTGLLTYNVVNADPESPK